jgi:tripartite-type tricarboxylate transporter receptor subunit TctC
MIESQKKRAMRRGQAVALMGLGILGGMLSPAYSADKYPERSISWIVPYGPGGGTDIVARIVTKKMVEGLGSPIVVENRPGGNTMIGTQALLNSKADGYTAMQTAEQIAANESLYKDIKFKVDNSFSYVAPLVRTPLVLVARQNLPAETPKELFNYLKSEGGKVNYGSWGQGGMNHLTMEALSSRLGVKPVHIPFPGAAAAITALVAGNIDLYFSDYGTAMPYIQAGRIKPLLVSSKDRLPMLPNVPTVQESGLDGFDMYSFQGVVMPKGVPAEHVQLISSKVREALQDKEVHDALMARGFIPSPGSSKDFEDLVLRNQAEFDKIIRDRGIKIE